MNEQEQGTEVQSSDDAHHVRGNVRGLVLGAVGVVFGDLGTSPLYTMKEAFHGPHGMAPEPGAILGVLSMITWTLVIVVAVKYAGLVMRADNKGEGGVMALMALAQRATRDTKHLRKWVVFMALLGASFFLGDSVITPSITVLSAMEGLEVAAPALSPYVMPLAVVVLIGLFSLQRFGTAKVGALFGPVMVLWFLCLAAIGIWNILGNPAVLWALNPVYAFQFLLQHGTASIIVLGAVVLCVTGAEALYTDMGHFGRVPIRLAWFCVVMPGVLLSYFGQGALLLETPEAASNPFFLAAPDWALYPMVALATVAAVIASQSVISGAFTITRHAIQLGFVPRMTIHHTSSEAIGQIYLPWVNRIMMIMVILIVIGFQSSAALAGAYGLAVTGTMAIDTVLTMIVARRLWKWNRLVVGLVGLGLLVVDLTFFGANTLKIMHGGWLPLLLGAGMFTIMITWRRGRKLLSRGIKQDLMPLKPFLKSITDHPPTCVSGTALFLTADPGAVPHALLHNLKHNKVLHERNILLKVKTLDTPVAVGDERIELEDLGGNFWALTLRFGFAEDSNVPRALQRCQGLDPPFNAEESTFFTSRETVIAKDDGRGMALWRDKLFSFMSRNAVPATAYFHIPPNRQVELGAQVSI